MLSYVLVFFEEYGNFPFQHCLCAGDRMDWVENSIDHTALQG